MDDVVGGLGEPADGTGAVRARPSRSSRGLLVALATWALLVAAFSLAPRAQAFEEASPVVTSGPGGFTWESQKFPDEWGYMVAIAHCSEESCHPEEFEVEKVPGLQSFVPYAQNLTKIAPEGTVWVGVAVLPTRKGKHMPYRATRVGVPLQGEFSTERLEAPKEVWTEGAIVRWSGLPEEIPGLAYKVGVSTGPRFCEGVGCRETKYPPVPTEGGRSFSPCIGHLGFSPEPSTAYIGVAALKFKNQPVQPVYTGAEVAVKLAPCPPPKVTTSVSSVTQSFAELEGEVDPLGSPGVECVFEFATAAEYSTNAKYGHKVPCRGWSQAEGPKVASATLPLAELTPRTTYHFRLVAHAPGIGDGMSPDATFTTLEPPQPPIEKHPPMDLTIPTLSGTSIAGYNDNLTVLPGFWTNQSGFAYQWQRCDANGNACANIIGATATSFPLSGSDVGHRLRAIVTATNGDGSAQAMSGLSAVIGSTVGSKAEWEWARPRSATVIVGLTVGAIPAGGTLELTCQGRGCPFHARKVGLAPHQARCRHRPCRHATPVPRTQVTLAYPFGHGSLRPGTVLSARVAKAGWATRVSQFTTRGGGREAPTYLCLLPGMSHSVACQF